MHKRQVRGWAAAEDSGLAARAAAAMGWEVAAGTGSAAATGWGWGWAAQVAEGWGLVALVVAG